MPHQAQQLRLRPVLVELADVCTLFSGLTTLSLLLTVAALCWLLTYFTIHTRPVGKSPWLPLLLVCCCTNAISLEANDKCHQLACITPGPCHLHCYLQAPALWLPFPVSPGLQRQASTELLTDAGAPLPGACLMALGNVCPLSPPRGYSPRWVFWPLGTNANIIPSCLNC